LLQSNVTRLEHCARAADADTPQDFIVTDSKLAENQAKRVAQTADLVASEVALLGKDLLDGLLQA
jgi:L-aminopeptidase/D-esterase-like protein